MSQTESDDGLTRDFVGYGGQPPRVRWPGDARVAVSLVLNIEEGAELALSMGDERNEAVHEVVSEVKGARDTCMESHFEYGSRAGYWRIAEILARHGIPCTLNICARAIVHTPALARHAVAAGHEISCHGYRWETHAFMDEAQERAVLARSVDTIERICGAPPTGFHAKSGASPHTRRLLVEHGGFAYDSNAYNDDLPHVVSVLGRPHVVLPYSFDTNDMRFTNQGGFVFGDDFARYGIDAFDWLWQEGATTPKMMTIGLHTRIIGRPGRIAGLDKLLTHIKSRGGAWFARRAEIAAHWRQFVGLPAWAPRV
jgi:allantoinase